MGFADNPIIRANVLQYKQKKHLPSQKPILFLTT